MNNKWKEIKLLAFCVLSFYITNGDERNIFLEQIRLIFIQLMIQKLWNLEAENKFKRFPFFFVATTHCVLSIIQTKTENVLGFGFGNFSGTIIIMIDDDWSIWKLNYNN